MLHPIFPALRTMKRIYGKQNNIMTQYWWSVAMTCKLAHLARFLTGSDRYFLIRVKADQIKYSLLAKVGQTKIKKFWSVC